METVCGNLAGWAQEVFLIDSYSLDDTVGIALRHGVRVVQRGFRGFGDQWNFALRELPITAPWTMKLDPDERLTPELKAAIQSAISTNDVDAIRVRRRLWFMGRRLPVQQELVRVWRTGSCRFSDVLVNEHPLVSGMAILVQGELEHHDSPNLHHWWEKQNNYSTTEAISAFRNLRLSADPRLFGTSFERRMWLKQNFRRFPFRYAAMHLYGLIGLGAWRAGSVGLAWARMRADLYRMRDLKLDELRFLGKEYDLVPARPGAPDPRVPQCEATEHDYSHLDPALPEHVPDAERPVGVTFHDRLARGWDERYSTGGFKKRSDFFVQKVQPLLSVQGKWLDVGCGSGHFARLLSNRGADVEGIDGSAEMVRSARDLAITRLDSARLQFNVVKTVERLPYPDASFDGVLCLSVLEYLDHPDDCFAEMVRVLRPGGQLVVSVPNRRSLIRAAQRVLRQLEKVSDNDYLKVSTNSWTPRQLELAGQRLHLTQMSVLHFDPMFPSWAGGIVPQGMLFLVATK